MTYAQFITRLRAEANDNGIPEHVEFTGDGTTTLFQIPEGDFPVLESSYTVKVNGSTQTETTAYTLDKEAGLIRFSSAPTDGHPVTIDYKKVKLTDSSWINIINYILDDMEGPFFKEVDDPAFDTSEADTISYSGPSLALDVVRFYFKTSDNASIDWSHAKEFTNWRFSRDENLIKLGRSFPAGYPLRVHYLKGFERGDESSDTLDIQDRFLGVLQLGCMWRFFDYLMARRTYQQIKAAKEDDLTPLSSIREQSRHYQRLFETQKQKKKPTKPSRPLFPSNQESETA